MVALGGENAVEVLQVVRRWPSIYFLEIDCCIIQTPSSSRIVASFHVGARITALAWSPRTVSSSSSDQWFIEFVFSRHFILRIMFESVAYRLAAAGADFGLHLLTKSATAIESTWPFGGCITGHHGKVNDMSFCGGRGDDSHRYVATVSGIQSA